MLQWFNVDTVDTVVFAAFTQMHTDTQTWCTAYMPLAPPREKALKPPVLWVKRFTKQSEDAALF